MKVRALFWKYEPAIFLLLVLISLSPLLVCDYFPTLDGPAHLHNGNLLRHLWFEGNKTCLNFFNINTQLNSNILDHVWYALFGLFLPGFLVEKSLLLVYVITLPYAFRFFVKQISRSEHSFKLASYLIFPFIYSFVLRIGFLNFCVGIVLVFLALGFWIKHREGISKKQVITLMMFVTLAYISHLLNFLFLGIVLVCYELQYVWMNRNRQNRFKELKRLIIIFLPGMLLLAIFFAMNSGYEHEASRYLPFGRLIQTLVDLSPIITLSYDNEVLFAHFIMAAICILLIFVVIQFFRERKNGKTYSPSWLVSIGVVLILFFIFPDWVASGGFISVRWATYFFLLLLSLIAAQSLPARQLVLPVLLTLITHIAFIKYHTEQTLLLNEDALALVKAGEKVEANKVLLPLNYSANWMQINHGCYLATEKNVICLDNYEPCKPHFPFIWKPGQEVYKIMPHYGNHFPPCIDIEAYEQLSHQRIDYLSTFCYNGDLNDSCNSNVDKEIHARFDLIYQSENKRVLLYKRKPGT